jgi:phosphatidyl-myo-inositol alpha-mannosyltransferase
MRIAMAHQDLPNESKGGVPAQAHHLANALTNHGHEVTMFTFSPTYPDCQYQVHQYARPLNLPKPLLGLQVFLFAVYLAQTDFSAFDILHTHGDNYLQWRYHPHVRTFHGSAKDEVASAVRLRRRLYQKIIVPLEDWGARVTDLNVGVSLATQAAIPQVSKIIPNGVDLKQFYPGVKASQPVLLFVGTTTGRKRGNFLAEIFQQQIRPQLPNAELWSVAEADLEGEGIVNYGRVSQEKLTELYRAAWVFCLPSTYEGFGVPYIEAMASGTAVVASPNPGAIEVLQNGTYGLIPEDQDLGREILQLLLNEQKRQEFASKGLSYAQTYDINIVAQTYVDVYRALIDQKSAKIHSTP